ncbi:hypothetical protein ADUPG1_008361 [Aduncisulcus paluster]|uniref:HECT domain-containing protein n=1 Tax=Aduncisulcus paluster TaxID=2918883 RepID=A0ABQ5KRN1_9EUKA|nr:hypothetical protein ADUPG1_008361 [Aduncisulcus paluster]
MSKFFRNCYSYGEKDFSAPFVFDSKDSHSVNYLSTIHIDAKNDIPCLIKVFPQIRRVSIDTIDFIDFIKAFVESTQVKDSKYLYSSTYADEEDEKGHKYGKKRSFFSRIVNMIVRPFGVFIGRIDGRFYYGIVYPQVASPFADMSSYIQTLESIDPVQGFKGVLTVPRMVIILAHKVFPQIRRVSIDTIDFIDFIKAFVESTQVKDSKYLYSSTYADEEDEKGHKYGKKRSFFSRIVNMIVRPFGVFIGRIDGRFYYGIVYPQVASPFADMSSYIQTLESIDPVQGFKGVLTVPRMVIILAHQFIQLSQKMFTKKNSYHAIAKTLNVFDIKLAIHTGIIPTLKKLATFTRNEIEDATNYPVLPIKIDFPVHAVFSSIAENPIEAQFNTYTQLASIESVSSLIKRKGRGVLKLLSTCGIPELSVGETTVKVIDDDDIIPPPALPPSVITKEIGSRIVVQAIASHPKGDDLGVPFGVSTVLFEMASILALYGGEEYVKQLKFEAFTMPQQTVTSNIRTVNSLQGAYKCSLHNASIILSRVISFGGVCSRLRAAKQGPSVAEFRSSISKLQRARSQGEKKRLSAATSIGLPIDSPVCRAFIVNGIGQIDGYGDDIELLYAFTTLLYLTSLEYWLIVKSKVEYNIEDGKGVELVLDNLSDDISFSMRSMYLARARDPSLVTLPCSANSEEKEEGKPHSLAVLRRDFKKFQAIPARMCNLVSGRCCGVESLNYFTHFVGDISLLNPFNVLNSVLSQFLGPRLSHPINNRWNSRVNFSRGKSTDVIINQYILPSPFSPESLLSSMPNGPKRFRWFASMFVLLNNLHSCLSHSVFPDIKFEWPADAVSCKDVSENCALKCALEIARLAQNDVVNSTYKEEKMDKYYGDQIIALALAVVLDILYVAKEPYVFLHGLMLLKDWNALETVTLDGKLESILAAKEKVKEGKRLGVKKESDLEEEDEGEKEQEDENEEKCDLEKVSADVSSIVVSSPPCPTSIKSFMYNFYNLHSSVSSNETKSLSKDEEEEEEGEEGKEEVSPTSAPTKDSSSIPTLQEALSILSPFLSAVHVHLFSIIHYILGGVASVQTTVEESIDLRSLFSNPFDDTEGSVESEESEGDDSSDSSSSDFGLANWNISEGVQKIQKDVVVSKDDAKETKGDGSEDEQAGEKKKKTMSVLFNRSVKDFYVGDIYLQIPTHLVSIPPMFAKNLEEGQIKKPKGLFIPVNSCVDLSQLFFRDFSFVSQILSMIREILCFYDLLSNTGNLHGDPCVSSDFSSQLLSFSFLYSMTSSFSDVSHVTQKAMSGYGDDEETSDSSSMELGLGNLFMSEGEAEEKRIEIEKERELNALKKEEEEKKKKEEEKQIGVDEEVEEEEEEVIPDLLTLAPPMCKSPADVILFAHEKFAHLRIYFSTVLLTFKETEFSPETLPLLVRKAFAAALLLLNHPDISHPLSNYRGHPVSMNTLATVYLDELAGYLLYFKIICSEIRRKWDIIKYVTSASSRIAYKSFLPNAKVLTFARNVIAVVKEVADEFMEMLDDSITPPIFFQSIYEKLDAKDSLKEEVKKTTEVKTTEIEETPKEEEDEESTDFDFGAVLFG